jgi:hypothetical protein
MEWGANRSCRAAEDAAADVDTATTSGSRARRRFLPDSKSRRGKAFVPKPPNSARGTRKRGRGKVRGRPAAHAGRRPRNTARVKIERKPASASAAGHRIRLAAGSPPSSAAEGPRAPPRSVVEVCEGASGERLGSSGYSDHSFSTSRGTVFAGRSLRLLRCASAGDALIDRSAVQTNRLPEARRAWPRAADMTDFRCQHTAFCRFETPVTLAQTATADSAARR